MEGFQPPHTLSPSPAPLDPKCRFLVPHSLSYVSLYRTLLPRLSPAVLRENTRDCGVQVNARVDKCVQCSLGPKTLFCPIRPSPADQTRTPWRTGPASVSSSVLPEEKCADKKGEKPGDEQEKGSECTSLQDQDEDEGSDNKENLQEDKDGSDLQEKGSNLQVKRSMDEFLEQRYGFFHCKQCNIRWESAYVWCIADTSKVYYKQLCRKCRARLNPFRVESIFCKGCLQTACTCERKQRHIDMKRPHRQDLCCRCKDKRLSCDVTIGSHFIV